MYIFFLNLWIWLQSCPTDGTVAEFLWDNIRCPERSQEWAAMVQDQHKVRQAVLWSRRLPEVTENTETASPILSGTGSCTTLSLSSLVYLTVWSGTERFRALCSDKQKNQDAGRYCICRSMNSC